MGNVEHQLENGHAALSMVSYYSNRTVLKFTAILFFFAVYTTVKPLLSGRLGIRGCP